ncbi:MAG: metallophosphoesterase [Actinomycetes bacterium]
MKINLISDVHAEIDALSKAANGSDILICLGDLLLYTDYEDPGNGIMGKLFGYEFNEEFIRLRTANMFVEARAMAMTKWEELGDRDALITREVKNQYQEIFNAMPTPVYLTYGNVDRPEFWQDYVKKDMTVLDGQVVEIAGLKFGFVGGGLQTPYRTPYEITDEEFQKNVDALGPVDILCSHIPPAIPDITFDVVARRFERGSEALLNYIKEFQPKYSFFGHVHQPLVSRTRIGYTECINVGHFRATKRAFTLNI